MHSPTKLYARHNSWYTYDAELLKAGTEAPYATVHYPVVLDRGTITIFATGHTYKVKHKIASGIWNLIPAGEEESKKPILTATKPKVSRREVLISTPEGTFCLAPLIGNSLHFGLRRLDETVNQSSSRSASADMPEMDYESDSWDGHPLVGKLLFRTHKGKPFQGEYLIEFCESVPAQLVVFCYWIVNMFQRREEGE